MGSGLAGPQPEEDLMPERHETEHESFGVPDEAREFPNGRAETLNWYGASKYARGD
jgi:hypothetical protein